MNSTSVDGFGKPKIKKKLNMKKLLVLWAALIAVVSINAADVANISVDAGYNNHYIVNGVSRADNTPALTVGAIKSFGVGDVYLGGTLLPNSGLDQSHWVLGAGKSVELNKDFSIRLTGDVTRHQSGIAGIPNSTEFGTKLALANPYVTPYVRGAFDIDLHQNGVFVGAYRTQKLFYGVTVTPAVEYGYVNNYETLQVKGTLARSFVTRIGTVTPYAEVGWFDNDFKTKDYNFATREFAGTVVYSAGVKFTF
jgi:hypothetical protein